MPRRRLAGTQTCSIEAFIRSCSIPTGAAAIILLVVLSEPWPHNGSMPSRRHFVQDYAQRGLAQAPEVFPKQPDVNEQRRYGNWARLPGRHHTRDHWTKVWDGKTWLEDHAAVEAILSVTGDSPDLIPASCTPVRRVGVGPRVHSTFLPMARMIGWRSSRAQGRAIDTTACSGLLVSCSESECRPRWWKSCASSGMRLETNRRAKKSMCVRPCATSFNGTCNRLRSLAVKQESIAYRRHGNEQYNRNHAGNHYPH